MVLLQDLMLLFTSLERLTWFICNATFGSELRLTKEASHTHLQARLVLMLQDTLC